MNMSHGKHKPSFQGDDAQGNPVDGRADSMEAGGSAPATPAEAVSDSDEQPIQDKTNAAETGEPQPPMETSAEAAAAESERYLRLAAEFDNYKKRTVREFEDIVKRANARLLREVLAIIDNFERALTVDPESNDSAAYRRGIELIYNQLIDLLKKEGITAIETVGKPFDPNLHEAVMQVESDNHEEGIVCGEMLKGYSLDGKVLRHANVAVSRGKRASDKETNNDK